MRVNNIKFFYVTNNMESIIEPNDTFDFSKLSLAHPSGIQGGAYFTKILNNTKPLYIQTSKSVTRQGFVKSGKKYYCDLMFDNNAESLIRWFENLEQQCHKLLFAKSDAWFQNTLDANDIENAFSSIIRVYKSGKFYLVRTNIKNNLANEPSVKIYSENQTPLNISDVTPETNIISILEIQGIKFTTRNFQVEIELKQVMILDNEPIFDSFLIKTSNNKKVEQHTDDDVDPKFNFLHGGSAIVTETLEDDVMFAIDKKSIPLQQVTPLQQVAPLQQVDPLEGSSKETDVLVPSVSKTQSIEQDINVNTDLMEIHEITLEDMDVLKLKRPNQVYYELYKEARKKAKVAKKNAIVAYLETKNIKTTYMLDDLNESDSDYDIDFDNEIEDASESELDSL